MPITYQLEPDLTVEEFIDVLVRSTLGERRPIDDRETIAGMLQNADVILTARDDVGWSASRGPSRIASSAPISPTSRWINLSSEGGSARN